MKTFIGADEQIDVFAYAVRMPVVLKYTSQLTLILALLTIVPIGVSIFFAEYTLTFRYVCIELLLLAFGLSLMRLPAPTHIQVNEAFAIISLTFIMFPFMITYPMMEYGLSFLDALFEAISGITTTGLTTVAQIEEKTKTFHFTRAWMQWYGGLGFVVLSVALLMRHNVAARRLVELESTSESIVTATQTYARRVIFISYEYLPVR